jgi:hypothetical protein
MQTGRPLTSFERGILIAFLGTLPAIFIGFYTGLGAARIGTGDDPTSILQRALVCAAFPAFFAFFTPRLWWLPAMIYAYGFQCGYFFADSFKIIPWAFLAPFTRFAFIRHEMPEASAHAEFPWIAALVLWLTTFIAFLRTRRQKHEDEAAESLT